MRDFVKMAAFVAIGALLIVVADQAEARGRGRGWSEPTAKLEVTPVQYSGGITSRQAPKLDGASGYNADLVTDLPQDQGKLYLTLIVSEPMDQRQQQLAAWFTQDPRLVHFRTQCHWNFYSTTNPHYVDRLYHRVGTAVPIVCLQKPDGEVLLNVTAKSMPRTSGELADMINDAVQVRFAPPDFRDLLPDNSPTIIRESDCGPDGCPQPPSVAPVSPIPEVLPSGPSGGSMLLVILFVGVVLLAGLGGVLVVGGAGLAVLLLRRPAEQRVV